MKDMTLPESLMLPPRTTRRSGAVADVLSACAEFGRRGMLVHGASLEQSGRLRRVLDRSPAGLETLLGRHAGGEPTLAQVEALRAEMRAGEVMWIAAVGGGSVMDLAKAAAGLLDAPLPVARYHEGADIPAARIPFVAAPATAGTGSECTTVSVLTNEITGVKKSIRHPSFMARLVVLDPDLLESCPRRVVAASGMDALTQAIESFISRGATWMTDTWALRAMRLIAGSLEAVWKGESGEPRHSLMVGSYLAGLALSNARLGLVHGLAHPLGARYHVPHGQVCAVCLPWVLEFNKPAIGEKYTRMHDALGGDPLLEIERLLKTLNISSPFPGHVLTCRREMMEETLASGSTQANPRAVSAGDVETIWEGLFASPER